MSSPTGQIITDVPHGNGLVTTARVVTDAPHGSDTVPTANPVIGWVIETGVPNWLQSSAELELNRSGRIVRRVVEGRTSVRIPWVFDPLEPREEVSLRVRVTAEGGTVGEWSEWRRIFAGFLGDNEWTATPIGLPKPGKAAEPGILRTEFNVASGMRRATFYATAVGGYQAVINGADVDDQVMKPGWTPFDLRTVHETTDVTNLLQVGANAIGVRLAGAWGTEVFGFRENARRPYGDQPRFAGQLILDYDDGHTEIVATNSHWQATVGPITESGLYGGESYDARIAVVDGSYRGYADAGYDASAWSQAAVKEDIVVPEARTSPFVRRLEELPVLDVIKTPSGKTVLDFGQNLVGRLRIRVSGPAGTVVTLRHAEVLEHGELGTRPLRRADATDRYTLSGEGVEEWEPEFTLHGFRYAEVSGWPGTLNPADVVAVVIHSDMERTGWFETSHPLVARLHENIVWSLRGNFLYVPSDCPQRDERLGWTGDIQIFAPTASFLYDVRGFLDSWLVDLAVEQERYDGIVPFVVPHILGPARPAAAWGDAAAIVPWVMQERFADIQTLDRQFPSMVDWVDTVLALAGENRRWEGSFQFGDWLDPDSPPDQPGKAKTDPDIVATAYLYRSADLTARTAKLLGRQVEAEKYGNIAAEVREAFLNGYVTPEGRMMSDAPTAYALAIVFDIAPRHQHAAMGQRLAHLVEKSDYRISTGFVGTPIIQDALTRTGHLDVATRLLTEVENPSWLYPVTMGATTVWERWDSMLPDGSINPGQMTSFNHYALGAVGDWLHRVVAGLAPDGPGYERLRIEPRILEGFDSAAAEHLTPYGTARAGWRRASDHIVIEAVVPANTVATVVLPDGIRLEVGSGAHRWEVA